MIDPRHIEVANLRDASFVFANLRPQDDHELMCQLPEGVTRAQTAHWSLNAGAAFVAYVGDEPVAVFGTNPINAVTLSVWLMGTKRLPEVIGPVTRFLVCTHIPFRIAQGYVGMECRVWIENRTAVEWLKKVGGLQYPWPFEYGKGGERFVLFRWTVAKYRTMYGKQPSEDRTNDDRERAALRVADPDLQRGVGADSA